VNLKTDIILRALTLNFFHIKLQWQLRFEMNYCAMDYNSDNVFIEKNKVDINVFK
jgi:hypothetical protein